MPTKTSTRRQRKHPEADGCNPFADNDSPERNDATSDNETPDGDYIAFDGKVDPMLLHHSYNIAAAIVGSIGEHRILSGVSDVAIVWTAVRIANRTIQVHELIQQHPELLDMHFNEGLQELERLLNPANAERPPVTFGPEPTKRPNTEADSDSDEPPAIFAPGPTGEPDPREAWKSDLTAPSLASR